MTGRDASWYAPEFDLIDPHRFGDVLQLLRSHVLKFDVNLPLAAMMIKGMIEQRLRQEVEGVLG